MTGERGEHRGSLPGADALSSMAPQAEDLEHQRIVERARGRLFGGDRTPRIARYRVDERLGEVPLGERCLGHDEGLDRPVIVLHARAPLDDARTDSLRACVDRLALLAHPNVARVYEMGEHAGRPYLAVEHLEGPTLGEWLAEQTRPWAAILAAFVEAGQGLAAYHGAGLVHRDFRVDNVSMDRDGGVHLADLGFASIPEGPAPPEPRWGSAPSPALPSPEQLSPERRPQGLDARSDQVAFCAAAAAALWPQRFDLEGWRAHLSSGARAPADVLGPLGRAPSWLALGPRAPHGLWRVLRRGLARDPDQRWPSMDALVLALVRRARAPRRRARALLVGLAATSTLVGASLVAEHLSAPAAPDCRATGQLDEVWTPAIRGELDARARALTAEHAEASGARVLRDLDAWSASWSGSWAAERRILCEGPPRSGEASLATQRCLETQRAQVAHLVELLREPPGAHPDASELLSRAVLSAAALPLPAHCRSPPAAARPLSSSTLADSANTDAAALRLELDRARTLQELGHLHRAYELARQSELAARDLGDGPLEAQARARLVLAELALGPPHAPLARLDAAAEFAEDEGLPLLAAELWALVSIELLAPLESLQPARAPVSGPDPKPDPVLAPELARAARLLVRAQAALAPPPAPGTPPLLRARLEHAQGLLALARGDARTATERLRAALDTSGRDGRLAALRPLLLTTLSDPRLPGTGKGEHEREREGLRRQALLEAEALLGPAHPQLARYTFSLGQLLYAADPGDPEALALFERSAGLWRGRSPAREPSGLLEERPEQRLEQRATVQRALAIAAIAGRDSQGALEHAYAFAKIQAQRLPPDAPEHAAARRLLADADRLAREDQAPRPPELPTELRP